MKETRTIAGGVTAAKGFTAGGLHCGIKKSRPDLGWIYSSVPATSAAVYTKNVFQAAPLTVTADSIQAEQKIQAVLVNSGVANACTGAEGLQDAYEMRRILAEKFGLPPHYVAVASTGVIGSRLPLDLIDYGVAKIVDWKNSKGAADFERAIMTTDLQPKNIGLQLEIDGCLVTIGGAAKGSGMINPNMATMLAFLTTDALIDGVSLTNLLKDAVDTTFNMIAVDGDTSTNDMVLVLANGQAGNDILSPAHPQWPKFAAAFTCACQELAKKIAKDGEGATKLVEVTVRGGICQDQVRAIGKTVILSSLVKTAIFGADPNWGRIVCAIGYSNQQVDPDSVQIKIGPVTVFQGGVPLPFDKAAVVGYLQQAAVQIEIDLGLGLAMATAWGCDLTYDYVKINAEYTT